MHVADAVQQISKQIYTVFGFYTINFKNTYCLNLSSAIKIE